MLREVMEISAFLLLLCASPVNSIGQGLSIPLAASYHSTRSLPAGGHHHGGYPAPLTLTDRSSPPQPAHQQLHQPPNFDQHGRRDTVSTEATFLQKPQILYGLTGFRPILEGWDLDKRSRPVEERWVDARARGLQRTWGLAVEEPTVSSLAKRWREGDDKPRPDDKGINHKLMTRWADNTSSFASTEDMTLLVHDTDLYSGVLSKKGATPSRKQASNQMQD